MGDVELRPTESASSIDAAPSWAKALAGPALIVVGSAIVLRGFWLGGRLTNQHVDLLAFWLPRWCYLGSTVSAGHIPTWLPSQFGGVPFVSDPQSGWLYAPVMALFSTMSCARALDVMIVLNPIVAGLGLYVFFRNEGTSRTAAAVGGLTVSLSIASSVVALSMPFAGTLAWTAVALAGAAGYLHARTPARTLGWLGVTAFGLSQVAAALLTDGLLIATAALVPYLILRSIAQVRAGERRGRTAALLAFALLASFPVLAAAILIPRFSLLPRTSIGHGYVELAQLAQRLSGFPAPSALVSTGLGPEWATAFARGPSGYVGVLAVILTPVALMSKRWRVPALAFALAGFAGWALNLNRFVHSARLRSFALRHQLGELWLRSPERFKYLLILAFAGLAGYGVQAWLDFAPTRDWATILRRAARWLPALVLLVIIPIAQSRSAGRYAFLWVGLIVAAPLLYAAAQGKRWPRLALPVFVAVELTTAGLLAQTQGAARQVAFDPIHPPAITPHAYLTPDAIGRELVAARGTFERYLTLDPTVFAGPKGFLGRQAPSFWPAYEDGRSILFGIDEIQGYSPLQLDRYWRLVRRVAQFPIFYNAATFQSLRPEVIKLFGVGWLILRSGQPPPLDATPIAEHGAFTLYQLTDAEPRASIVYDWTRVPPGGGLDLVLQSGFDPASQAVVEDVPAVDGRPVQPAASGTGTADYGERSPKDVVIRVTSDAPGLLVVRNAFDRNWHATVDGRPAPVLIADYLMQGVAIPAGTHTVELSYRDPAVGLGLLVSVVGWAILIGLMGWFAARDRRQRRLLGAATPVGSAAEALDPSLPTQP
jgi:hypothetical protein